MFYRHRRRSVARCTNLPAQSARKLTRNFTKRTKHFVRSGFVTPNHEITSIKSINLEAAANNAVINKNGSLGSTRNCQDGGETTTNNPTVEASGGGYLAKKVFGQTLSTFSNGTPTSEKYQFTTTQSEDSAAHIKTLETRKSHQKPSTPECLFSNGKKSASSNRAGDTLESVAGPYYLNMRSNIGGLGKQTAPQQQQLKPRSPTEYSARLSNSSKKPTCDSSKKDHTSSCAISISSCDKHSNDMKNYSKKSTMSTIHSISDCDVKPSIANGITNRNGSSPNQIKRQGNFFCEFGKFKNLPAPKHLVAAGLPGNHSQMNKL